MSIFHINLHGGEKLGVVFSLGCICIMMEKLIASSGYFIDENIVGGGEGIVGLLILPKPPAT